MKLVASNQQIRLLSSAVEQSSEGIVIFDLEGHILFSNPAMARMHGYTTRELCNQNVRIFFNQEQLDKFEEASRTVHKKGIWSGEIEQVKKDGTTFSALVNATLLKNEKEQPIAVVAIIRDITERKRIEKQLEQYAQSLEKMVEERTARLKESEEKYRQLFENARDSIFVIDYEDATIVDVNKESENLTGYSKEELLKMKVTDFKMGENVHSPQEAFAMIRKFNELRSSDIPLIRKDGTTIWMDISSQVMTFGNKKIVLSIIRDITQRKETEREILKRTQALEKANAELNESKQALLNVMEDMEQAHAELEEKNRILRETQAQLIQAGKMTAMGQLGAGIAHELNQPLTGIRGYTQLIKEELDQDSPLREDLEQIEKQTDRMVHIINNLRQFARESPFEFMVIDPNKPIEDALMLMTRQLEVHNIRLIKKLAEDLPRIMADSNQLQQVYINLINNARDAIDELSNGKRGGEIYISSRAVSNRGYIEVMFRDTGGGIPDEIIDRIFDPFFTTKVSSEGKGMGLGLSITHGIIENHSGRIEVESEVGVGTTFRILLPTVEAKSCWQIIDCKACAPGGGQREHCRVYLNSQGQHCWVIWGKAHKEKTGEWLSECMHCEVFKKKNWSTTLKTKKNGKRNRSPAASLVSTVV